MQPEVQKSGVGVGNSSRSPPTALLQMPEFDAHLLLGTETISIWDVVCPGRCRHNGAEECAETTHLVLPYRGVFVHHVGRMAAVADANQVIFLNAEESYRVGHPVEGGDACVSISLGDEMLRELSPREYLKPTGPTAFNRARLRIDAGTQSMTAQLRYGLDRSTLEPLEAEVLGLVLLRRALGERTSHASAGTYGREKLVDRTKLVLAADLSRRLTLGEIAAEVGVSPVYLTQVFQQIEGLPLYRYQMQLRLARALDTLGGDVDLTGVALDLGFSSYSHFSTRFKRAFGLTPFEFRRAARLR
jgi:AraC-like DNA-binding protein